MSKEALSSVQRIIDWNERRGKSNRGSSAVVNFEVFRRSWQTEQTRSEDFFDLVPIRLVTLMEVFTRETTKEIVDRGGEFFERAAEIPRLKVDLTFAAHIQGQKLTLGDLIAHSISTNDIDQINSAFETLLPGFKEALAESHDRFDAELSESATKPIIDNIDALYATLKRLFQVRHILTHEVAKNRPYAQSELAEFFEGVAAFFTATTWHVSAALYGPAPLTQIEMNIQAAEQLEKEMKRLAQSVALLRSFDEFNLANFDAVQAIWEKFADSEANLIASQVEGGSMSSMVWAGAKMKLVRQRIKHIQDEIDNPAFGRDL